MEIYTSGSFYTPPLVLDRSKRKKNSYELQQTWTTKSTGLNQKTNMEYCMEVNQLLKEFKQSETDLWNHTSGGELG